MLIGLLMKCIISFANNNVCYHKITKDNKWRKKWNRTAYLEDQTNYGYSKQIKNSNKMARPFFLYSYLTTSVCCTCFSCILRHSFIHYRPRLIR
jgi:anaerobic C4-dicarboxylate transporter